MQKLGLGPSASDAWGSVMFQFDNALFHFRPLRALHCWTSLHCSRWVVVWLGWICLGRQLPCLVQSSFEHSQPHIYAWDLPRSGSIPFRFSCSVAWRCWNSSWRWSSHKLLLTARWTVESLPERTIAFCSAWWCPDGACVLIRIVCIATIECIPELETVCDSIFCWKEGVWSCVLPGPWLKLDCLWDG